MTDASKATRTLERKYARLLDAARGLCFGEDWNNGTHARLHGYRAKLIAAVADLCPDHPVARTKSTRAALTKARGQ